LPAGDLISVGPIAGTSAAVKRASWAMHGVATEAPASAPDAGEPAKTAATPAAQMTAIREPSFAFQFFEEKQAEELKNFRAAGFRMTVYLLWDFPSGFLSMIVAGCLSALSFRSMVLQALFIVVSARTPCSLRDRSASLAFGSAKTLSQPFVRTPLPWLRRVELWVSCCTAPPFTDTFTDSGRPKTPLTTR
jgi:hypothetical protein